MSETDIDRLRIEDPDDLLRAVIIDDGQGGETRIEIADLEDTEWETDVKDVLYR